MAGENGSRGDPRARLAGAGPATQRPRGSAGGSWRDGTYPLGPSPRGLPETGPAWDALSAGAKWELAGGAGGGYCIEGDTDDETGHGFPTVAPSTGT